MWFRCLFHPADSRLFFEILGLGSVNSLEKERKLCAAASLLRLLRVENVHVGHPLVAIMATMHHQPRINHRLG
jgi:hypothetical protein